MKAAILKLTVMLAATIALAGSARGSVAADPTPVAPTTAPTTAPAGEGPERFYGSITAVDKTAKTFTVDNQVYSIVAETQLTKAADDSAATLADAVVGEPARGSYTRTADGKLNVTKVRFGKKAGGAGKAAGGGKAGGGKKKAASTQP